MKVLNNYVILNKSVFNKWKVILFAPLFAILGYHIAKSPDIIRPLILLALFSLFLSNEKIAFWSMFPAVLTDNLFRFRVMSREYSWISDIIIFAMLLTIVFKILVSKNEFVIKDASYIKMIFVPFLLLILYSIFSSIVLDISPVQLFLHLRFYYKYVVFGFIVLGLVLGRNILNTYLKVLILG